jgi:hypothetical protein
MARYVMVKPIRGVTNMKMQKLTLSVPEAVEH